MDGREAVSEIIRQSVLELFCLRIAMEISILF